MFRPVYHYHSFFYFSLYSFTRVPFSIWTPLPFLGIEGWYKGVPFTFWPCLPGYTFDNHHYCHTSQPSFSSPSASVSSWCPTPMYDTVHFDQGDLWAGTQHILHTSKMRHKSNCLSVSKEVKAVPRFLDSHSKALTISPSFLL